MKYCPKCNTRYDEEILRFCMKDGTPLLEEDEPNFVEMPSESLESPEEDDARDETVIRRNIPVTPKEESYEPEQPPPPRIVVPTTPEPVPYQARPRIVPPPESNTFKVVILTMLGTIAVLAIGAAGFWFLQNNDPANTNVNINANINNLNTNVNTNLGIDGNFNFNTNANFDTNSASNIDSNANVKTPTPRPSPSVSPSPTRTPDENRTPTPTRTPFPTPSPIIIRPGVSPQPRMSPLPPERPGNSGV